VIDYRKAQFEKVLQEKVDVVFDVIGGDTQAVVPRLEGRRPSHLRHPARIAGREREAPCVGRDDEARAVRGRARQNRATAGSGDDPTGRRDRTRSRMWPAWKDIAGTCQRFMDVAHWAGERHTQATRKIVLRVA